MEDTIAAIATAPGEGGIGIIRVSGPNSFSIADKLFNCSPPLPSQRASHTFVHGTIRGDDHGQCEVDEAILLIYRSPASYTAEDVVEFQCHGGQTTLTRVLRRVLELGARPADAGEFTKRAFLNGRIDLLQAEAVMDIIQARSDRAAAMAVEQLEGRLSIPFNDAYDGLMSISADLEATLDFSEDELPPTLFKSLVSRLQNSRHPLEQLLASWDEGRLLRHGATVVIAGKPNVGKSTLLNALVGHARAIVTDMAGTTRDTIEEELILHGFPIRLIDTAGIRSSTCRIEQEGIVRAQAWVERADLTIWIVDISQHIDMEDVAEIEKYADIIVLNKADLVHEIPPVMGPEIDCVIASLNQNQGVDELKTVMAQKLGLIEATCSHGAVSERHRNIINQVLNELNEAVDLLQRDDPESAVFVAAHLREALERQGTVTGRTYSDALLDTIFSRFCVGK